MRNAHLQPVFVFGKEIAQGIGKLKSQLFAQSKRDGKNRSRFGGFLRKRGGGDLMNRFVVGSSSFRGLNVTQISDPGERIVGMRTSHDFSLIVCASSQL